MRIQQIYSKFGWHLKENFKKKYGLREARDRNSPVLFFGAYGSQILDALKWAETTKVVIYWSGSDCAWFVNNSGLVEQVKNHPNISHIATVNYIENHLKRVNIPYKKVPLFSQFIDEFKPSPLGDSIYIYKPGSAIYCPRYFCSEIRDKFKSVPFILAQNHHEFNQSQLKDVYAKSILAIRLTKSDGLSHTAAEMGLCGRKIIWNGDTPNAVGWKDYYDVLVQIEKVLEERYDPFEVARQMKDYLDVGESWLEID
jgi:hypothetical protein